MSHLLLWSEYTYGWLYTYFIVDRVHSSSIAILYRRVVSFTYELTFLFPMFFARSQNFWPQGILPSLLDAGLTVIKPRRQNVELHTRFYCWKTDGLVCTYRVNRNMHYCLPNAMHDIGENIKSLDCLSVCDCVSVCPQYRSSMVATVVVSNLPQIGRVSQPCDHKDYVWCPITP